MRCELIRIVLVAGLALAAHAAELDTTMHPMSKPGVPSPPCPACPALDSDEDALRHERGATEFGGAPRDEYPRVESGGGDDGLRVNVGGLLSAATR